MSTASAYHANLTITNDLSALAGVREMVRVGLAKGGFPAQYLNRLQIAVDEAVTNIVEHGYTEQVPGKAVIELDLTVERERFRMIIEDHGSTFDPEEFGDIDIQRHVSAGHSGGLGVFLMRKIMDLIEYHAEKGKKNRLVLVKYHKPA